MDHEQGPSLLEYARFHGIATPSTTINPLDYIDQTLENHSSKDETSSASNGHTTTPWESTEREINSEKLNLSKNDARLLSMVIRDMRAERVEVNWDDYLPSIPRIEDLKVDFPALKTRHELDMATLASSVCSGRESEALSLLRSHPSYPLTGCSNNFVDMGPEIEERAKMNRLNCTKESFLLIQNARRWGDIVPEDTDACLEADLEAYRKALREPGPPLIPIDFDELYSPSPSPKLQMLPSPVSSNSIKRHESRICLQGTDDLVSIFLGLGHEEDSGPLDFSSCKNGRLCNGQHEAKVKFNRRRSIPIGHTSSGSREEENTETKGHLPDSTWNLVQAAVSTQSEVELASGSDFSRRHSTSFSPTLQLDSSFTFQETVSDGENDVRHPVEIEQGPQDFAEGERPKAPPPETCQAGYMDKEQIIDRNWYEPQVRTNEHATANDSCYTATFTPKQSNTIKAALVGEECHHQTQVRPVSQSSNRQRKRKKVKDDHSLKKQQRRFKKKETTIQLQADNGSELLSPFTALGSLPAFMETRGIISKRRVNAASSYFAVTNKQANKDQMGHKQPMLDIPDTHIEPGIQSEERVTIQPDTIATQLIPQYKRNNQEPPILFLSTSLLKSHLRLTRILETTKDPPPTLIYRDYDKHTNKAISNHDLQHEADIIISPSTGIILTTSQATTQLYLPGHKPAHPHLDGIKGINSPLRERIVLLASRYERLYVLVSHSGGTAKKQPTADKRTLTSMTSLTAFCTSMSGYSTVIPLIVVPSVPEIMAQWILGLAGKHSFRLPEATVPRSLGFTPINPSNSRSRVDSAFVEIETQWELFLRRAGLNPFAAQIVLLVLRGEEDAIYNQGTIPALPRFVEMSTETRRRLFAGLIGERVLKRVEAIMDNDWQCDWALNFDAIQI